MAVSQKFTRESIELFQKLKEGEDMQNMVELDFATQFEDFRDMSTLVGLTGGATCSEVGISRFDCH